MMDELAQLKAHNLELETVIQTLQSEYDRQIQEVNLLRQFDRQIARIEDLNLMLDYAMNWIMTLVHAESGCIAAWNTERNLLETLYKIGTPQDNRISIGAQTQLPGEFMPSIGQVEEASISGSATSLIADLRRGDGHLVGIVLLERAEAFNPDEQRFIRYYADRLTVSLHHTMLINRVQALNQYRAQLFRMLSHDLRQPLTVLKGYTDLLKFAFDMGNHAVMGEYLENLARGARDLAELLEEVLLREQVENPNRDDWVELSMQKICQQSLEKYEPMAALKAQELEISLTEQSAICRGMSLQLKEAVGNIISNAIKYTPDKGQIKIKLWREEDRIYFEVVDTGYGISRERQARLFEVFYRAQEPGTENIKGTGIGLNLVKGIIENHDGEVYFRSERGRGSTFGFWLPAVDEN